jgi:hypothetical protein
MTKEWMVGGQAAAVLLHQHSGWLVARLQQCCYISTRLKLLGLEPVFELYPGSPKPQSPIHYLYLHYTYMNRFRFMLL